MTRPFPSDPQWLQLSRKLPPDAVIERLIRFGFRISDIADAFQVDPQLVSYHKSRLGLEPIHPGSHWKRNGARPSSRYFG